ncbi:glycosyltransferase [Parahaliea sp. F7430]|uniref:Glycosyltransferase n=1 Tax=Sediminihaliea albiluteola TaxID=2758564 RepID=A0A7W2TVE7_9GAMM|nr:glycosyltransferase [Sediminihaliea albiluteola]MBA6412692.1 glycosyltransferase [Sediminihaliea albiluteola]
MTTPVYSVVIATRNRPKDLLRAVESVLAQTMRSFELLVVDDGSEQEVTELIAHSLESLSQQTDIEIRYLRLGCYPRGRGPAYARNVGSWCSSGQYLAFLDDDDLWTDQGFLSKAYQVIGEQAEIDLLYANQMAVPEGGGLEQPLWLHGLAKQLQQQGREFKDGCYRIFAEDLMAYQGFNHLNTTLVRREFFVDLGGFNEYLRYEEDLDFYLRCVDQAQVILHLPEFVAQHHIPDASSGESASLSLSRVQRLQIRRHLLSCNYVAAEKTVVRNKCRQHLLVTCKRLSHLLVDNGEFGPAYVSAKEALVYGMSLRWFAYTIYLGGRLLMLRARYVVQRSF